MSQITPPTPLQLRPDQDAILIGRPPYLYGLCVSRTPVGDDTMLDMATSVLNHLVRGVPEVLPEDVTTRCFGPGPARRVLGLCIALGVHYHIHPAVILKNWQTAIHAHLDDVVYGILLEMCQQYHVESFFPPSSPPAL